MSVVELPTEHTYKTCYGFYPSARQIRKMFRQQEQNHVNLSAKKFWKNQLPALSGGGATVNLVGCGESFVSKSETKKALTFGALQNRAILDTKWPPVLDKKFISSLDVERQTRSKTREYQKLIEPKRSSRIRGHQPDYPKSMFQNTSSYQYRHHIISPGWISESLTRRRLLMQ